MKRLFALVLFSVMAMMARGQLMTPSGASTISNRGAFFLGFRVPQVASLPLKPDLLNYTGDSATGSIVFCLCAANPSQKGFYGWSTNQWLKLSTSADGGVEVAFREVGVGGPDGKLAGYSTLTYDSATGQLWIKNTPTPGTYQLIVEGVSNFAATVTSQAVVLGAFTMPNEIILSPQTDTTDNKPLAINLVTGELHRMRNWPTGTAASGLVNGFYTFSSILTASDPGGGRLRLNNINYSAVTQIYINELSQNGTDASAYMNAMRAGDVFYVQDKDDASRYSRYTITGTTTDNGSWRTIPVTFVSSSGSLFANNGNLALQVNFTGGASNGVTGSGVANQVTFWNGTNTVTGDNNFVWRNPDTALVLNNRARVYMSEELFAPKNPKFVIHGNIGSNMSGWAGIGTDGGSLGIFTPTRVRMYFDGGNMNQLKYDFSNNTFGMGYDIKLALSGDPANSQSYIAFAQENGAPVKNKILLRDGAEPMGIGLGIGGGNVGMALFTPVYGPMTFSQGQSATTVTTANAMAYFAANGGQFVLNTSMSIGGGLPNVNSLFDAISTTKGTRPHPLMSSSQFNSIASKPIGLTSYDTDKKQPVFYDGTTTSYMAKVVIGSAAPASTPDAVGQIFIDTVGKKAYISTGTASSADWTILN